MPPSFPCNEHGLKIKRTDIPSPRRAAAHTNLESCDRCILQLYRSPALRPDQAMQLHNHVLRQSSMAPVSPQQTIRSPIASHQRRHMATAAVQQATEVTSFAAHEKGFSQLSVACIPTPAAHRRPRREQARTATARSRQRRTWGRSSGRACRRVKTARCGWMTRLLHARHKYPLYR